MTDLPPTYSDLQWAAFCAGTWQKEVERLRMDLDNYKLIARQAQKERDTIAEENYTLRALLRTLNDERRMTDECPLCGERGRSHDVRCDWYVALEGQ